MNPVIDQMLALTADIAEELLLIRMPNMTPFLTDLN